MSKSVIFRQAMLASIALGPTTVIATGLSPLPDFANQGVDDQTEYICQYPVETEEKQCDSSENEKPFVFDSPPIFQGSLQIDLRPENCQSFFDDYLHTRRGLRIESALETTLPFSEYQSTVSTFPIVDFYAGGHIRIVKTRNLTVSSFSDNPADQALFKQLMKDAEDINTRLLSHLEKENVLSASVNGQSTRLHKNDVKTVTIDVVIQAGMATSDQVSQMKTAADELQKKWGFVLQIIEIP